MGKQNNRGAGAQGVHREGKLEYDEVHLVFSATAAEVSKRKESSINRPYQDKHMPVNKAQCSLTVCAMMSSDICQTSF